MYQDPVQNTHNHGAAAGGGYGGYQGNRQFGGGNNNNRGFGNDRMDRGGYGGGGFGRNAASGAGFRNNGGGSYGGFNRGIAGGAAAFHQQPHEYGGNNHYHREEKSEEEIFKEHTPGINFDQYEAIKVSITPNNIEPAEAFATMNLAPALAENVARCRYQKPTPVQRYGIPCVLSGSDLMACAQTGSGKTAAYLIPAINLMLVNNVNRAKPSNGQSAPSTLVIAPTRELSIQIYEEGRKFTYRTGIRCVVVYGGADPRHQIHELARGCGLLVATPGRLIDMFSRGYTRFSDIRFLVLDEADRMLDMGFEPQIRQLVQGPDTDMPQPGERQTLLYSATFPKEIQQLAREFLHHHHFLQVGRVGSTTENITQDVRWVEDVDKRKVLQEVLSEHTTDRVLVFVEKKRDADFLERFLHHNRLSCRSIHGDRVQREREEALDVFKNGVCRVLVATDVASRGLDIPNVAVVVQYDLPSNIDDYVHRIGRTGRAGKCGTAISFFNEKNRNIVDDLIPLLRETNQTILPQVLALAKKPNIQNQTRGRGRGGFRGGGGFGGRGGYHGGFRGGNGGGFGGGYNNGGFRPRGGFGSGNANSYGGGYGGGTNGNAGSGYYNGGNRSNMRSDVFGQRMQ
ncbi:putative ATP-dependent RNA helicase [Leptomonas seymouri]|uniref:Probable eukaryotic initiation factor 4A n=1 Tax=Leptomonas seymouri TaxID=5684 RepID=A0A0N1I7N1_LEPSE|nr:putative ATP-dependent RNA helicase [Leptomonas seymouri]|eukprot:KPI89592.1 putative ATP-dependent RNA helicase [Leptomonas seymouri]